MLQYPRKSNLVMSTLILLPKKSEAKVMQMPTIELFGLSHTKKYLTWSNRKKKL